MKVAKPNGSAEINRPSDVGVRGNSHELTLGDGLHRQVENSNGEMSASGLGTLVRRVSEASRREIGNLVGELQMLDKKLQTDGDRVEHYITEYAELNQQVMQLTTIISDSVKKLPEVRDMNR